MSRVATAAKAPPKPAPTKVNLIRYMIRAATGDVWIWTEDLAKRKDTTEVWARNPQEALEKDTMPDPQNISLTQLSGMSKEDLIAFARVKLGISLDGAEQKNALLDQVKQEIFMRPSATEPEDLEARREAAISQPVRVATETKPIASPGQARSRAGV